MPKQELGHLEQVELREIWTDEAKDFTPWLARPDNLQRLSDALGLDLELEDVEVAVGPYSADIVATDGTADQKVVIENQLERTNHDHLGKLITYASGLGARVMIWIAKEVTEEHRRAIDFLNEHSGLNMRLYALEIQAVRIGDSKVAPLFKVIASPNEYSEAVHSAASVSGTKAMYLEFWNGFRDFAASKGTFLNLRKATTDHWFHVAIGRHHFNVSLTISSYYKRAGCELLIEGAGFAKAAFHMLRRQQREIEAETGPLEWMELPEAQRCKVVLYKHEMDPIDKANWPPIFAWLKDKAELFHRAFAARVRNLPIEETEPQAMAAEAN